MKRFIHYVQCMNVSNIVLFSANQVSDSYTLALTFIVENKVQFSFQQFQAIVTVNSSDEPTKFSQFLHSNPRKTFKMMNVLRRSHYGFSVTCIFLYKDKIYDHILIKRYEGQRKPIIWYILRSAASEHK